MGALADLFRPAVDAAITTGADAGSNYLIDNQAKIEAELKALSDQGVDAIATELTNALPDGSLGQKLVRGEIVDTINNVATDLKAKIDAGVPLDVDWAESLLEQISAANAPNP